MSTEFTDVDDTGDEMRKKRHERARKLQSPDNTFEPENLIENVNSLLKTESKFPVPPISCQPIQDQLLQTKPNVSDDLSEFNNGDLDILNKCLIAPDETDNLDLTSQLNVKDMPIIIEGFSKQHCSSKHFETEVLKKFKTIKHNQTIILDKIDQLEKKQMVAHAILQDDDTFDSIDLLLKNLFDVDNAEKLLENKVIYKKMVKDLRCIGGVDLNSITNNVLKRLLSNSLCESYSLRGQGRNPAKSPFTDLQLYKVVLDVVRYHKPEKSEKNVDEIIGRWLTEAKLRCSRDLKSQERRSEKRKLPVMASDSSADETDE